ncbi:MAG: ABC transporter [Candidatus Nealsonbacteria bacterium CG10_big_fil_rev_8_21_14_0_10_36_24]|uniref:ABC transporter n=2 Tax=Candidatus Nealsoniibacteriota TaxID=1817911 RepID=A0A2H0YNM6_9BACT|nr:MAG: ABC transporter [Candidatus Nealsonbacteria bacterium CG10_big_fil_rev_8_21_14_0_10_36_24]PIS40088.1 MAG: ABC transporter [Candidatus Nealsonbacteria bacterium CG08_land_8_20_14_0_20_36_22]
MPNPIIKINNLSKRYRIGAEEKGDKTFRETIMDWVCAPINNFIKLRNLTKFKNNDLENVIWALKDISFEINEGEVLGIIGKNGSGKTTLLKVLSRITQPTNGFAELYGRVSSLLDVGTGFHPELTGRENIYLNGAILGMRKKEIEEKFDEIVAFSEIGKFIDTPVKRFSSGMWVRLAFAIAAHLEPEILLIDEVLAVGDISFQKKCLGKVQDVVKGGRTVLFVSHNMGVIRNLCKKVVWIDNGKVVQKGDVDEVVKDYEKAQMRQVDKSSYIIERNPEEIKNSSFYFNRVEIFNEKNERTTLFRYNEKLNLIIGFAGFPLTNKYSVEFHIYNELGQMVSMGASGSYHDKYFSSNVKKIKIGIGPLTFTSGRYRILLKVLSGGRYYDIWENAAGFNIIECQPFKTNHEMSVFREGACILQQSFDEIE